jgi:hypothetical protein
MTRLEAEERRLAELEARVAEQRLIVAAIREEYNRPGPERLPDPLAYAREAEALRRPDSPMPPKTQM